VDCSDCHQTREKEGEAHHEAEDVLVVAGEPARGQGHHEKKSELGRNSCVCGREKDLEHDLYGRERSPASTGTEIQFSCGGRAQEY
jgi:hypothetical protein